jgi:hypothetical protein
MEYSIFHGTYIKISKGQAIDEKRETNARGSKKMKMGDVRVSKQEQQEALHIDVYCFPSSAPARCFTSCPTSGRRWYEAAS